MATYSTLDMSSYISSNSQYPEDIQRDIGLRDKQDAAGGLSQVNPAQVQIITVDYTVTVDTRDCIGAQSLIDAQTISVENGVRDYAYGIVSGATGAGISPIILTVSNVTSLKNGDTVTVKGVNGNTNANGISVIFSVTTTGFSILGTGNGTYTGSGEWSRQPDAGFPVYLPNMSIINDNVITVNLPRPLKEVRTLALFNIVIPRDIIPLIVYIPDFITSSTTYTDVVYTGLTETNYTTFIKEESVYTNTRLLGFYTSPLDLYRAYRNGSLSIPDTFTPAPLQLWNPTIGSWPTGQPIPYPYQTVPTYKSNTFTLSGLTLYIILSGYGVYDLLDWTYVSGNPVSDSLQTSIIRKLLLILICPIQSYLDQDYVTMILNCSTVSSTVYPFGYGDFQRFIPGPGLQMAYQPGTNSALPGDPTVASTDSPIAFPNFRGNVWGPYSAPGDRFQKLGTLSIVQDLYLNGDLQNLSGNPVIRSDVPTENIPNDSTFGLNFLGQIEVNLGNVTSTTNPNILNAMRILPNGFGAVNIRANGSGAFYTNIYNSAGGQGPSNLGAPSTWTNNGVYGGTGTFTDPIAKGPTSATIGPDLVDASYSGLTDPQITHRVSYYDLGPGVGSLIGNLVKYISYCVDEIPDSDLIIKIEEASRDIIAQSTNARNGNTMLDCPIRLSIGSSNGTQQYIESVQSLVSGSAYFWEQKYGVPIARIEKLHIGFYTYDGTAIPLEKMLQTRKSVELSRLTARVLTALSITTNPFNITFLFSPTNPVLAGRLKRYIQIMFRVSCYQKTNVGLLNDSYAGIGSFINSNSSVVPFS